MTDFLINFVVNLDPNNRTTPLTGQKWPKYTKAAPKLLTFQDGVVPLTLTDDTYRSEAFDFGTQVLLDYPI
jgi:acetylcholinesterase